ncbi:MAG: hypothetical protein ED559_05125 [Phycisphaera sp.]|nr:MAG: hypothetical protein ED559_05125 [Phycisphaera sp.]
MRRGLTLLELLFAIGLLAGVAAAIVPLTRTALVAMHDIDQSLAWQRSADMTLSEIDRLLLRRDRDSSQSNPIRASNDRFIVRTATGVSVTITHEGDKLEYRDGNNDTRLLLGRVSSASFELSDVAEVFTVTFESSDGLTAMRSWEIGS